MKLKRLTALVSAILVVAMGSSTLAYADVAGETEVKYLTPELLFELESEAFAEESENQSQPEEIAETDVEEVVEESVEEVADEAVITEEDVAVIEETEVIGAICTFDKPNLTLFALIFIPPNFFGV